MSGQESWPKSIYDNIAAVLIGDLLKCYQKDRRPPFYVGFVNLASCPSLGFQVPDLVLPGRLNPERLDSRLWKR